MNVSFLSHIFNFLWQFDFGDYSSLSLASDSMIFMCHIATPDINIREIFWCWVAYFSSFSLFHILYIQSLLVQSCAKLSACVIAFHLYICNFWCCLIEVHFLIFTRAPEIDISELESLFSAVSTSDGKGTEKGGGRRGSNINKPEKVQLVIDIFFRWAVTVIVWYWFRWLCTWYHDSYITLN